MALRLFMVAAALAAVMVGFMLPVPHHHKAAAPADTFEVSTN